jgi:hypothetical protein
MGNPTFYSDDAAITAGQSRVTGADFEDGCNPSASCAHGLGINIDGGALPAETGFNSEGFNWTLQDQDSVARTPQVSQVIGGDGTVPRSGNVATTWDTTQVLYTVQGAASSGGISGNGSAHGESISDATNPANVDGSPVAGATITEVGNATLTSLGAGWVSA